MSLGEGERLLSHECVLYRLLVEGAPGITSSGADLVRRGSTLWRDRVEARVRRACADVDVAHGVIVIIARTNALLYDPTATGRYLFTVLRSR